MKKLIIIALMVIGLQSCVYQKVDDNTDVPNSVQQYSQTLKDSVNGIYIVKKIKDDYIFKKDSTSVRLIEKYDTNTFNVSVNVLIFFIILFFTGLFLIVAIIEIFKA